MVFDLLARKRNFEICLVFKVWRISNRSKSLGDLVSTGVCSQSLIRERSFGGFIKKFLALKEIPTIKLNKHKGLKPFIRHFLTAAFLNEELPFCFCDLHSKGNVMCRFVKHRIIAFCLGFL